MPNLSPPTENLALGRGKRKKLNHQTVSMRMSPAVREQLEIIAESYECTYGGKPWIAGLLEKIGLGELLVVPSPPLTVESKRRFDPKDLIKSSARNKFCPAPLEDGATNIDQPE